MGDVALKTHQGSFQESLFENYSREENINWRPIPNHKTYWVKGVKKKTHFLKRGADLKLSIMGVVVMLKYCNIFPKEKLQIVSGNAVIRRMSEEDGGQTDTGETKVGW